MVVAVDHAVASAADRGARCSAAVCARSDGTRNHLVRRGSKSVAVGRGFEVGREISVRKHWVSKVCTVCCSRVAVPVFRKGGRGLVALPEVNGEEYDGEKGHKACHRASDNGWRA